jgi:hypothetical protein
MSFESEQALRPELSPGERLIWSGAPRQGLRFRVNDILLIPFSLLWGGFAFFWEYSVLTTAHAPFFFALWGIPFVLVGTYIIGGRFFLDSYLRARTFYGLTDQRVLIVNGLMSREVTALQLRTLAEVSFRERSDGSGSITFGSGNSMYAMWSGTWWPGMSKKMAPAFDLIDDVRKVQSLIKDAQNRIGRGPTG